MRKNKKLKTVLDLPFDVCCERLSSIIDDVYKIIDSPKFVTAIANSIEVPQNATVAQLKDIYYGDEVAKKVKEFITLFLIDEREAVINILSTVFCQDKDVYRKKSVNEIMNDIASVSNQDKGKLLSFFHLAR